MITFSRFILFKILIATVALIFSGCQHIVGDQRTSAQKKVDEADPNIAFFSIGLGSEIDTQVLTDLGKTFSVFAGNKEELEDTFNDISQRVSEQANSFYLFEYCSPKRDGSGENNLAIQLTDGSRQGAVQTKFDATGFEAGCE